MVFVSYPASNDNVVLMGGPFGRGVEVTEAEMKEIIGNVCACKDWEVVPNEEDDNGFHIVRDRA